MVRRHNVRLPFWPKWEWRGHAFLVSDGRYVTTFYGTGDNNACDHASTMLSSAVKWAETAGLEVVAKVALQIKRRLKQA